MNEFHLPSDHPLNLKTIIALDYGEKFTGVALYCVNRDPYPTPYGRIATHKGLDYFFQELKRILDDECAEILVIGIPHLTDGKTTSTTEKVQKFIGLVREQITMTIETQDETLSTFEAETRMKNSPQYNFKVDLNKIDAVAASVILEDFIRRKKANSDL